MAVILLNLLIGLLYSTEGALFAKDPLDSGSSSFAVLPQLIVMYTTSQYYQVLMKHMFELPSCYCHICLACTGVRYERN